MESMNGTEITTPTKKHKKHKHKKHRKKKDADQIESPKIKTLTPSANMTPTGSPIRLCDMKTPPLGISPKGSKKKKLKLGKESGTSSDEERWLDAIQSGKLEEVDDELKKIKPKDPKLMTARQRAMLERKGDAVPDPSAEQLLSLPTGYREKVMTPEMIKKAALKSQKRKQLLDEKREKDKKRTMERLLRKQENKANKQTIKKNLRKVGLTVSYCNNQEGISISFPPGMDFPVTQQTSPPIPPIVYCGITGCKNTKRYSCSKTKMPLCSLKCYKKNMSQYIIKTK